MLEVFEPRVGRGWRSRRWLNVLPKSIRRRIVWCAFNAPGRLRRLLHPLYMRPMTDAEARRYGCMTTDEADRFERNR